MRDTARKKVLCAVHTFLKRITWAFASKAACIKKRFLPVLIAGGMMLSCSGCYYYGARTENLLMPPKLTDGQNDIYKALTAQVGTDITLKYPRTGNYRSAFVIENIDAEPGKEALVFYQNNVNTTNTSSLTVSVLDQKDGKWVSAYEIAGVGSDVDQVEFSTFGTQDNMFIIIGYAVTSGSDKVLHIYNYRNGVVRDLFAFSYTLMQVVDIDDNGYPEVVALSPPAIDKSGQVINTKANVIRYKNGTFEVVDTVDMDSEIASYVNVQAGFIDNQQSALYLDGLRGKDTVSTQILFYRDGVLTNSAFLDRNFSMLRQAGNLSMDLDDDGVIEIPVPEIMPGYVNLIEESSADSQNENGDSLYFTKWMIFHNGTFEQKELSYFNAGLGYSLSIPETLRGKITAKRTEKDKSKNEIAFYLFDGSLKKSTEELFRIRVTSQNDEDEELQEYRKLKNSGQLVYYANISSLAETGYQISLNTLEKNLLLLNEE